MKHKKTIIVAAGALAALAIAIFSLVNAETIENLEKQIRAAQKQMADLIPLLETSGGAPEENAAVKSEVETINRQADTLTSIDIPAAANQKSGPDPWQKTIESVRQTIDAVKLKLGI